MQEAPDGEPLGWVQMAVSGAAGMAVVGPAIAWLFREKLNAWADERARRIVARHAHAEQGNYAEVDGRLHSLEDRMSESEKASATMALAATNIVESLRRMTQTIDKIDERSENTALLVAKIDGTIEKRREPR